MSISESFFSGLDPKIYSGFKPEIHFFCINFDFFSAVVSISGFSQQLLIANSLVFYKTQLSDLEFWTFSQLFIARSMVSKPRLSIYNLTEFENPQKSYFRPEKDHFLVYFNMIWYFYTLFTIIPQRFSDSSKKLSKPHSLQPT